MARPAPTPVSAPQTAPARIPPPAPRSPGMLLPGERVFHLRVANNPTAEEPAPQSALENTPPAQVLKTGIPKRLLKRWEFQLSCEEALYALSCCSTLWGALGNKLRRLVHCLAFRREFRKWQVLLSGKSPDEQLWSVRPPRGGLTHRFILAWAQNALQLAGYDQRNMLTEWHIFWRRKGV